MNENNSRCQMSRALPLFCKEGSGEILLHCHDLWLNLLPDPRRRGIGNFSIRPGPAVRQRALKRECLMKSRVRDRQLSCKKSNLLAGHGAGRAVSQIAHHRKPHMGKLKPDLVVLSGFKINFNKAFSLMGIQHAKGKSCLAALPSGSVNNSAGGSVAFDIIDQPAFFLV